MYSKLLSNLSRTNELISAQKFIPMNMTSLLLQSRKLPYPSGLRHCGTPDTLKWRHNDHDSVSNHHPHGCLLNRLFRRRSKKALKLRVTGLSVGNSPGTGEFPAQRASYAENISVWWRHHVHTVATASVKWYWEIFVNKRHTRKDNDILTNQNNATPKRIVPIL